MVGTSQKGSDFFGGVRKDYLDLVRARAVLPMKSDRAVGPVTKTWEKVKKGTSALASSFLDVQRLTLTGNPSEEAIIRGALAHSKGMDIYKAIRAHQARMDKTEPDSGGKRKYYPLENMCRDGRRRATRTGEAWRAGAAAVGIGGRSTTDGSGDGDSDDRSKGPRVTWQSGGPPTLV